MEIDINDKILPILEVYTAIQSEGSRMGRPTIVVRTTGCTHRCYFGEGGWCDSFYTSIHPEKGKYTFNDIVDLYDKNPHITEMMITGGSPTMHPDLLERLTAFAKERAIITTLETEGSHFVKTTHPIDLVSISPKFSNSVPRLGTKTPLGKDVTESMITQHNKYRLNHEAMDEMIYYHTDYHIKPVWDGNPITLIEIEGFLQTLQVPKHKVWFMPAGDTRDALIKTYPLVMEMCTERGYNFTGRAHVIAWDTKREV